MGVSKLLFYTQSTGTVISGQTKVGVSKLLFYAQSTGIVTSGQTKVGVSKLVFYTQSSQPSQCPVNHDGCIRKKGRKRERAGRKDGNNCFFLMSSQP